MDGEEFEMMMYYFLFLSRKPKINCAKKKEILGLDPSFKKEHGVQGLQAFAFLS